MDQFFTENSKNEIVWDVPKLLTFTKDKNTHKVMYFKRTNRTVSILYYEKYTYNVDYDSCDWLTLEIENYEYFTTKIPPVVKSKGRHCVRCNCSDAHHKFYQLNNNKYNYELLICFECYALFCKNCKTTRLLKNHENGQTVYYDLNDQSNYPEYLYNIFRDAVVDKKYMFERYTLAIDHYHPSYLLNEYSSGVMCMRCDTPLAYPNGIPDRKIACDPKLAKCVKCIDYSRSIYRDLYLPKFILLFNISLLVKDIHNYIAPIFMNICNNTKFGDTIDILPAVSNGGYSCIMEEKEHF